MHLTIPQVVETPLLHPERFVNLGIEPPKGVLLYGPPGTGKTLCARAVANRTDACFIRVIGSELVGVFLISIHFLINILYSLSLSDQIDLDLLIKKLNKKIRLIYRRLITFHWSPII